MLKKLFWSKYMNWLRKFLGVVHASDMPFDIILDETNKWSEVEGEQTAGSHSKEIG